MNPRAHDAAELIEKAARALFERRAEHTGLRFDALPIWAVWVRESYLADARAALEAAGVIPAPATPQRSAGDRYQRLADAALRTAPVAANGRAVDRVPSPRTQELEALLLPPGDVAALGHNAVARSLDWKPVELEWNPPASAR
ncbi:MAG: hypothetical protein NVV70_03435 [Cellulomonas sp.]|uniref:Uncharacterized protein n=2 Tax=Cellulomonas TaxID=1707 RepID=A0A4Y3KJ71_9CELL|nr:MULTISPECIES: hypothetical protein [Cellulomonas]MCR6647221.1 hypothetical protein [Cellulomonas sp.]MCR6703237.1 hypothetical protein [Cellulomonas sp.]GEA83000.1 hypothetical protein CGE01nite_02510 [Cellulomonas gelida]GGL35772.1 hypothetical protein GCM10009774_27870 [Cellulomonas gelida]